MELKFLADVNVEKALVDLIIKMGYDIKWVVEVDKSMSDEDVLSFANDEQRILVTNDKGFGYLVFHQKMVSIGLVLIRVKGQNVGQKVVLVKELLRNFADKLIGHFVVVTPLKFRFIPLMEE